MIKGEKKGPVGPAYRKYKFVCPTCNAKGEIPVYDIKDEKRPIETDSKRLVLWTVLTPAGNTVRCCGTVWKARPGFCFHKPGRQTIQISMKPVQSSKMPGLAFRKNE